MYICIYVYMYMCICVYMYKCIYAYMYICIHVYMYICIYVYVVTRSAGPPSAPLHGLWQDAPPPVGWSVGSLFPCGVVVGVLGFWV